jgi:predicted nucleotidyltransferase
MGIEIAYMNVTEEQLNVIVEVIRLQVGTHSHIAKINERYVFGSYGDNAESENSDLDIIVGLENVEDDELEDIKNIFKRWKSPSIPYELDVVVCRSSGVKQYLTRACEIGNYSFVYDMCTNEHIKITNI